MITQDAPRFDAARYKETTRLQWDAAAEAWDRWAPLLQQWLGDATEQMLDMAGAQAGSHVLDVAAGAGDQTLSAARRVGPQGRVLATDISAAILERAAAQARRAGHQQVQVQVLDGESLDVPPASFDAVISRLGLIYFPDQQRALAGMHRALKPGGRVAAIVYSTPDRNSFFSIPVSVIRTRAGLGAPLPGQPGPFSLGGPGVLQAAFERAGFVDVSTRILHAPVRTGSARECVRFERESFGALHQMLATLTDDAKAAAWEEITARLGQFERAGRFEGPCELVIGVGTRPVQ
jgi:SAM-dependent methyltransferase